jgi:ABC-type lipoprotein export system ATPase subunit
MTLTLDAATAERMYWLLKRMNNTADFLCVVMHHPEVDAEMMAVLKLAEGRS